VRLRRSDCASPGLARRRRGRGFEYLDTSGERIADPDVLARIGQLTIPPAWREVWICPDPRGHLQATGIDAAGRKQYLYHERWRAHRDRMKFASMVEFGHALPRLRRRVAKDLSGAKEAGQLDAEELSRERVLACSVRLLDLGFFRIGSEDYAERNGSYGLATMLKRQVSLDDGHLVFDYPAKSGLRRVQAIADEDARAVVAALKRRRGGGSSLLVYRDDGHWEAVRSTDINDYIKAAAGADFTAKDFRTWNATVLAAAALGAKQTGRSTTASRNREISAAVKAVAAYLGNTPAVCRASYIDPRVFDKYRAGVTVADSLRRVGTAPDLAKARVRSQVERAVLALLDD
jgi:DNA topoisomerase IB